MSSQCNSTDVNSSSTELREKQRNWVIGQLQGLEGKKGKLKWFSPVSNKLRESEISRGGGRKRRKKRMDSRKKVMKGGEMTGKKEEIAKSKKS